MQNTESTYPRYVFALADRCPDEISDDGAFLCVQSRAPKLPEASRRYHGTCIILNNAILSEHCSTLLLCYCVLRKIENKYRHTFLILFCKIRL